MELTERMVHETAELLFPARLIPILRNLRGERWQQLVDKVAELPDTHPDSLAFVLMMVKLGPCMKCHQDNFRFHQGCAVCSTQSITYFKGSDSELLSLYRATQKEIQQHLEQGTGHLAAA